MGHGVCEKSASRGGLEKCFGKSVKGFLQVAYSSVNFACPF